MIRVLAAVALGLVCGAAFLMLVRLSAFSVAAAVVCAGLLASIFAEVLGAYNGTSRAANAARTQDRAGGRDRAEA